MNAIIGMADLLWDTPLTPDQRKYLRIFRRAGGTLLNLIHDILDLSKIEANKMELDLTVFKVSPLIEEIVMTIQPLAEQNDFDAIMAMNRKIRQLCGLAPTEHFMEELTNG